MELIIRTFDHEGLSRDKVYNYEEIDSLNCFDSKKSNDDLDLIFVTGNKNKLKELSDLLKPVNNSLRSLELNLTEIQDSSSDKIVEDKCRRAFLEATNSAGYSTTSRRYVMIDDTELRFNGLNGLPGPYIKWFFDAIGPEGLYKMLAGFEDKSAEAVCTYALMSKKNEMIFCRGISKGRITSPRGKSWGWDPIFEELNTGQTYGEMDPETKSKCSHRANAIKILLKFLEKI